MTEPRDPEPVHAPGEDPGVVPDEELPPEDPETAPTTEEPA